MVEHLSDTELLAGTRGLIARSNHQLARLLAHLAEVEARGIHRARACSSLYTYCVYELRLSEDTAFRYARAAKLARTFPVLFEQIAAGEIHLTGLLLLGPHLTDENHHDVLQLAKHRTKREIIKLVRRLDPLPDIPPRIEPLGPACNGRPLTNPTWSEFMQSLNPVRELAPSERPSNWLHLGVDAESESPMADRSQDLSSDEDLEAGSSSDEDLELGASSDEDLEAGSSSSDEQRVEAAPRLNPQRYSVQFTAGQEYVDLVERARALLSHAIPSRSLEQVHLRAMRLLVTALEKQKFAIGRKPRSRGRSRDSDGDGEGASVGTETSSGTSTSQPEASQPDASASQADAGDRESREPDTRPSTGGGSEAVEVADSPRRRGRSSRAGVESPSGRYVPADVRREVCQRDTLRCAYVAADGQRCRETDFLELHHHDPYARGGAASVENLALYCRSHNALLAERDFGRAYMARRSGRE